jgi:DNA-directed RNA polymerase subunit beta
VARDTKLGKEEITKDIPNVGEEALKDLDDAGVVRIGAEVNPGDILVGKITPKGETQLSPEEKLLRAIFGEKAGDVRDSSLKVPPGVGGIVIDARIFSRKGTEKDSRAQAIEDEERAKLERTRDEEVKVIRDSFYHRLRRVLVGKKITGKLVSDSGATLLESGVALTEENLASVPRKYYGELAVDSEADKVAQLLHDLEEVIRTREEHFRDKIERLSRGDELPPGVIKMVKVYIAIKRKLQIGDKMAGRHGNKGVVSRLLPEEDMPYLADGTPVDIVHNPLGVPSRMNVGQILETHLGLAARQLGQRIGQALDAGWGVEKVRERILKAYEPDPEFTAFVKGLKDNEVLALAKKLRRGVFFGTPVFDGAAEEQIKSSLKAAGLEASGQQIVFDGRTGEPFDNEVTVGVMYMLKLHHLVDDKIHARSIGPYSLVTQQPLGGKAQFGGQRLGEMEVWAMEAYGAAHALQEFLTVKSDDVQGRTRMYESIVKGEYTLEAGLPESFNVLLKELQSLCLNIELVEGTGAPVAAED